MLALSDSHLLDLPSNPLSRSVASSLCCPDPAPTPPSIVPRPDPLLPRAPVSDTRARSPSGSHVQRRPCRRATPALRSGVPRCPRRHRPSCHRSPAPLPRLCSRMLRLPVLQLHRRPGLQVLHLRCSPQGPARSRPDPTPVPHPHWC